MNFGSNRLECKSRLQSEPGWDLGKSHNLSVPQFPYLKKQCSLASSKGWKQADKACDLHGDR